MKIDWQRAPKELGPAIADDGIAVLIEDAGRRRERAAGTRRAIVGVRDQDRPPSAVVLEHVVQDRVVPPPRDRHAGARQDPEPQCPLLGRLGCCCRARSCA